MMRVAALLLGVMPALAAHLQGGWASAGCDACLMLRAAVLLLEVIPGLKIRAAALLLGVLPA